MPTRGSGNGTRRKLRSPEPTVEIWGWGQRQWNTFHRQVPYPVRVHPVANPIYRHQRSYRPGATFTRQIVGSPPTVGNAWHKRRIITQSQRFTKGGVHAKPNTTKPWCHNGGGRCYVRPQQSKRWGYVNANQRPENSGGGKRQTSSPVGGGGKARQSSATSVPPATQRGGGGGLYRHRVPAQKRTGKNAPGNPGIPWCPANRESPGVGGTSTQRNTIASNGSGVSTVAGR